LAVVRDWTARPPGAERGRHSALSGLKTQVT
jgi:hypothetical protein